MNTTNLHVLVVESAAGAADAAVDALVAAGHTPARCHEPGAPAFPCVALVDRGVCPLEAADAVDVALDVRHHPASQPTRREHGLVCALRHRVPTVVAGATGVHPLEALGATVLERADDIVAACEATAAAVLPEHSAIAAQALRSSATDDRNAPSARVWRRNGALVVEVEGYEAGDGAKTNLAARITTALRGYDRHARGIDVLFRG
jgi:hypothetical protein